MSEPVFVQLHTLQDQDGQEYQILEINGCMESVAKGRPLTLDQPDLRNPAWREEA